MSTTAKKVAYTLDSTLQSVDEAEQRAGEFCCDCGYDEDEVQRIQMAVREAAINAVFHGNQCDPTKKVDLHFERTPESLSIVVRDQGEGLDLEKIPDPLAAENLLKPSGRGIFLIRSFMDDVRFRKLTPGTEITLIKHGGPSSAGKEDSK